MVALVTGAAGGIGAAIARTLGEEGIPVALLDRDEDGLRELAGKLGADGLRVAAFPVDVGSSARVEAVVDEAERLLGPITKLVNAAGVLRTGRAVTMSDDDWAATFAVNVNGVFHVSRAVVSRMVPRRAGAVVTVASNAALVARADMAAYCASKAAATAFTKALGLEVAGYGIRCNVVTPGSADTPMLSALWSDRDRALRSSIEGSPKVYRTGIPLGKIATPADVAEAVAFLLSSRAKHITLQHLTVDGGATLGA
ncbi:2,3-dihydro-2,3-dihydroxybenzoate dehydrogenase [Planomonospora sp. ID67723]|uniref:2,3-dihydro-2,3-dihydroxybenzoate dehydrogenase n=1 Tax=Planomonospora sp. ID67723 TaxID=2738134 RepID=UPI0018C3DA82|nr:2,3-dihydro-2,3-dihydroxybenzoate dehydrogenase [Planomonospora sp. ID67723]MBG0829087.1 2,3-dihydro-2,3-dihydroxybenzoate dehydrogenase [Planomonospora sp. ID67723]